MSLPVKLHEPPAEPWPLHAGNTLRLLVGQRERAQQSDKPAVPAAITPVFELPDGTMFNRAPSDMRSWEIHATYRLAWHLAYFLPTANLAQALANWLCIAQHELQKRGEWHPETVPPRSM